MPSDETPAGLSEDDKRTNRRDRNNKACRLSRAKRKQRRSKMEERVEELEMQNKKLRVQAEELTNETHRLKTLLLERLSR